ncbi:hypothetical protein KEJ39_04360 [Candidatus Bathyarchaeota archaeon]|nr:hypothetical protein [Candidatus Bathyarchaeota archaeon]
MNRRLLMTFLLLALLSFQVPRASGASVRIELGEDSLDVQIESRLFQNMTDFPEKRVNVTGQDLLEAQDAFQEALRDKRRELRVSSLTIDIASSRVWMNVTARFALDGALDSDQDTLRADLGWLPLKVTSDLRSGNLSYNLVGLNQLRPYIEGLTNQTGVKYFSPIFTPITAQMAANTAGNVTIFDLQGLEGKIDSWPRSFDLDSQTTTWRVAETKSLDLRIQIETVNVSKTVYSYTNTSARISASGHALAFGDTVIVEKPSGRQELAMVSTLAGFLILSIAAHYYGRRMTARSRRRASR